MKILYFLQNRVRKMAKEFSRTKCFKEYADIHRIMLFFDLEHVAEVQEWVLKLTSEGKQVVAISFQPEKKAEPLALPGNFKIVDIKELDYKCFPSPVFMEKFKSLQADALMNLTVHPHPVLQYLALECRADYRVGFSRPDATWDDLLLEYDPNQSFDFLTGQLHFYMKSIRAK